jgi:hypothetical protein
MARYAIEPGTKISLLDPVPAALGEWFHSSASQPATIPAARLILHPKLRTVVVRLAKRWAQTGIDRHADERWAEAAAQYLVGGYAFALAGEQDEAVRSLLYYTDSAARLGRYEDAEAMLLWLEEGSGPASTADVLSRGIKMLSYRAAGGDIGPGVGLRKALPLLARLEGVDAGELLGSALISMANLHLLAGDPEEALKIAKEARKKLTGHNQLLAQQQIDSLAAEMSGPRERRPQNR